MIVDITVVADAEDRATLAECGIHTFMQRKG